MLFTRKAVGLEISHEGLAFALIGATREQPRLDAYLTAPLPAETLRFSLREPNVQNPAAFVDAVRNGYLRLLTPVKRVSVSLPDAIGRVLLLDLETRFKSRDEGADIIRWKLKKNLPFDVADSGSVRNALAPALETGTPLVLVNNAGFSRDGLMVWMEEPEWKETLSVHLDGFFFVTKMVLFEMLKRRSGRIINIVSTSGQSGVAGQTNYSAAKAGLIGATKSLALEVAKRNVLVNAVSPGFIETDMTAGLPIDRILPLVPLGRMGKPEEVAEVVGFLASGKASYITGQVISVNGGAYL